MYVAPQSTSASFSNIVLVEEQRLGEGCPVGMRLRDRNIVLRLCSRRASSVSCKKINQENKCLVPATSEHSQQHLTVVRQNSCNSFSSIRTHWSPRPGFPGFLHCRIVGGHTGSDLQTSTGSQISRQSIWSCRYSMLSHALRPVLKKFTDRTFDGLFSREVEYCVRKEIAPSDLTTDRIQTSMDGQDRHFNPSGSSRDIYSAICSKSHLGKASEVQ